MEQQKLYSKVRQAIEAYDMIQDGDKIAVGISGGKDSLTLLYALEGLRRFYPKQFSLEAITVHTGIDGMDFSAVQMFCEQLGVPYSVVETEIFEIVSGRSEKSLCSLCAKLRKGAFNSWAKECGCNKIAYAHHKDDVIRTFLMSLTLEGRIHTFSPVTYLEETGLTLIRPLVFTTESEVKGFCRRYELPVVKNLCPADSKTKRETAKELADRIEALFPKAKNRIFSAITNAHIDGW